MSSTRPPIHNNGYDLMSINHFSIYAVIGLLVPYNYVLCIVLSVLWEVFEYGLVRNDGAYQRTKKKWPVPEYYWNDSKWNRMGDFVFNILGYTVGSYVQSIV